MISATRIMYVECKASGDHRGRARICRVRLSKSGRTIYLGGLVLQSQRGGGVFGNYVDSKTGLEYWVSSPKKNGEDRHWAGGGDVRIEQSVVDEYSRNIREYNSPKILLWHRCLTTRSSRPEADSRLARRLRAFRLNACPLTSSGRLIATVRPLYRQP